MDVSTKSVSFHSSYLAKLREDKQQINECSSSVCKVISVQMLVIETSRLFIRYAKGLSLLILSLNIMYGSPVSTRDLSTSNQSDIASLSRSFKRFINASSTTTHWCKLRHCLLGSPFGLRI